MDDGTLTEREFFQLLARLLGRGDADALVREGISALVRVTSARCGVLELFDDSSDTKLGWAATEGCDEAEAAMVRATMSNGIVAEALVSGATVQTACAREDPRFEALESVRNHDIESVLCTAIGYDAPVGYVYLQGRQGRSTLFAARERELLEFFAEVVGPFAHRMIALASERARSNLGPGLEGFVGTSDAMKRLAEKLRAVAALDVQVLLSGPSGAGKTQVARAMHALSPRRGGPFVEINCAALPDTLLENELFGAERGAHSTALRDVPGKVAAAEHGTLFLDEIAELSLGAQAKLLQLLHDRTYYALGGTRRRSADIRIVVATHRDLREAVDAGRFRPDLYYRLNVIEIAVPSLAQRVSDVIPLAEHFLRDAVERHHLRVVSLSPGAKHALCMREWPGNVRELAHVVEAATLHATLRGSHVVEIADLEPEHRAAEDAGRITLHAATRSFQRKLVASALDAHAWNVSEVARSLDVARSHVYNLIRDFALERR